MPVFQSAIDPASESFTDNRRDMLALVTRLREIEARAAAKSEQRRPRFEHVDAVDTRIAVDVFGGDALAHQRPVTAGKNPDIVAAREVAHHARIALGQVERHIPGDRRNTQHLEFLRRRQRQEQCDRIVLPRVAIDDDPPGSHSVRKSGAIRRARRS